MTLADPPQRRFEVLRQIASGGFGTVFLCRQTQGDGFSRVVAIKLLHPQWSENEEVSMRLRDEARLLGLLRHRNIVDVFDLTRLDGRIAVVMEYLEAIDLKTITRAGLRLPDSAICQLGAQVASALDAAFNKAPVEGDKPLRVVHRDIKPSNIMVDAEGIAKVLDFGVARGEFASREARTQGMAFGSFEYMPSERRFMESGGETSDIYSLGAVLYELLSGGEKLGKGKLKAADHAAFVDERIAALHERLIRGRGSSASPRTVDELTGFLTTMLAFDADQRPTPSQTVSVLRRLARAFNDGGLDEWSEVNVPSLVARARATQDRRQQDPLVGRVLVDHAEAGGAPSAPVQDRDPVVKPPPADKPARPPTPVTGANPRTEWERRIPKRYRDAAPSRPPLTGTETPAPLRRAREAPPSTPSPPPAESRVPPLRTASAETAYRDPQGGGPSTTSTVLLTALWIIGLLVLFAGAVAFVAAAWVVAA